VAVPFGDTLSTSCATTGATAWFSYVASTNGLLSANTFGSNFDTVLAAYTDTGLSSLTQVACDDDSGAVQFKVTFPATVGTTYFFQAGGFGGDSGNLQFHLESKAPLANDAFPGTRSAPRPRS